MCNIDTGSGTPEKPQMEDVLESVDEFLEQGIRSGAWEGLGGTGWNSTAIQEATVLRAHLQPVIDHCSHRQEGSDMGQRYSGRCFWCGKTFRQGFSAHLAKNRACMILARAMVAEHEPELHQAADLLHVHAERICSDQFAEQHRLGDL